MGAALGLGGLIAGGIGSRSQKRNERDLRNRIELQASGGIEGLRDRQSAMGENPLLSQIRNYYMSRMGGPLGVTSDGTMAAGGGAGGGPFDSAGAFDLAKGGIESLFGGGFGLSDPQVRDQVVANSVEGGLNPAYKRARENDEADFARRGLGRSGLAATAARNRRYDYGNSVAGIQREVNTQSALREFEEQLQRTQAAQGLFGQAENANLSNVGQAAQFGLQESGMQNDLERMIAQIRMQLAQLYAGQGPGTTNSGQLSQNLFGLANMFQR